jgi:hypothetical protein
MKTIQIIRNTAGFAAGLVLLASFSMATLSSQPAEVLSLNQGTSVPISISASGVSVGYTNSGTYTASGAFSASGQWSEEYSWNGNAYHSKVEFTDANGSFELYVHGQFALTSATDGSGSGTWKMKKCTGAYAGMDGEGTNIITISNLVNGSGTVSQSFSGNIEL